MICVCFFFPCVFLWICFLFWLFCFFYDYCDYVFIVVIIVNLLFIFLIFLLIYIYMSFCDPLAKVQHQHPCSQVGAPNQGWSQVLADVVEPHSSLPWAPSRWLRDDLEAEHVLQPPVSQSHGQCQAIGRDTTLHDNKRITLKVSPRKI